MKTDAEIADDVARMTYVVGPTHAEWYAEACRVEYEDPLAVYACRIRELVRARYRDFLTLAEAALKVTEAHDLDHHDDPAIRDAAARVRAQVARSREVRGVGASSLNPEVTA